MLSQLNPSWSIGLKNTSIKDRTLEAEQIEFHRCSPNSNLTYRFWIVGELWLANRATLFKQLNLKLDQNQITDATLLTKLLEKFDIDCLKDLQGNFAIAIYDRRKKVLYLVRNPIGNYTLYYTVHGSTKWIAPRLKTLLPYHDKELDFIALRDYLACAFVPGERTMWRNVQELRPGMILRLPDQKKWSYWQLQENIIGEDQALAWHGQKLRSLLETIIPEYLPQNEPVGVYLSGGLDSSCITALARKFHNYPIHTYSIHFGKDSPNELAFSSLVAEHCQTQHHILEISPKQMWKELPTAMAHLDDPIGDPLTVPNYLLAQFAKSQTKVILNGEGGDPCFGGPKNQPMLLNQLYGSETSHQDIENAYLMSFQKCAPDLPKLLQSRVWNAVKNEPTVFAEDLFSSAQYLNRLMAINIKFKGADHILTKVNNLTRSGSLEGRSPLFDQRIVELSMTVPPKYKLAGAEEKAVLKEAVKDLLPDRIIKRPKSGMMVPVQLGFHQYWRREARGLLLRKNSAIAPYLNRETLKNLLEFRGDVWRRFGIKLWLLISLEMWLKGNR